VASSGVVENAVRRRYQDRRGRRERGSAKPCAAARR